ncbi:ABC transporter ATP-binding protein [Chitinophaga sp. 22321]|uniref:ABC transporter ATP-binding protein n=1 Tax=Chitinophaga hostae TaxID=2831022 RepID=A0ABS5J810_9BACT|nr:ABC transporter ATP-binding protein [Chitinophaga hostae]MBS0031357.1 ABC transporter ATP-binding protein [Chitinophaga hostae]
MSVQLESISKSYDGKLFAVENITFSIPGDAVYCLLGSNGSGKSTLLNIIANIIEPTTGQLTINDHSYATAPLLIKQKMGVQSQFNQVIGELNAFDFLSWIGLLYNMPQPELLTQRRNLLAYFFEEEEDLRKPAKTYSSGMQKKLAICAAVLHKPDLLILDEPFANLDPVACHKLCDFISAYRASQRIILISSHDLLYVSKVATHIGILHKKALVFNDTASHFTDNVEGSIDAALLKYLNPPSRDLSLIESIV